MPDIVATAIAILLHVYKPRHHLCHDAQHSGKPASMPCLFEAISALATVGLSFGITPTLSVPSKLILIASYVHRPCGGLTIIYATMTGYKIQCGKLPQEKISVGYDIYCLRRNL